MRLSAAQLDALKWLARHADTVSAVMRSGQERTIYTGPGIQTLRALERRKLVVGDAISRKLRDETHRVQWRLTEAGKEAARGVEK